MADNQTSSQPFYQQTEQQPVVSYLTDPTYNPTIIVQHHHHGGAINVILMAATATLVTLLCLFLAGVAVYLFRRRRRLRKRKADKINDTCSAGSQIELSRSKHDSDRDVDSSIRHSKGTCDTCSTKIRTTRPPLSYASTFHRQSQATPSHIYVVNDPPERDIEEQSNLNRSSFHLKKRQIQTPILESALAEPFEIKSSDYKGNFDWDSCAFELQEEEAMWLPHRPQSFASRQLLNRSLLTHSRSCSESATINIPPKSHLILNKGISKTRSRVTWNESQSDYFDGQRTGESSFTVNSPGLSPAQNTSITTPGSSEHSLLLPISPFLVHSPQRQSYSVRVETQDWENHTDAVENSNLEISHRYNHTPRSYATSTKSSLSEATAFSDPFGGSKVDLNRDFVVLSRPSPTRSEISLPKTLESSSPVDFERERVPSIRLATSPIISSPLRLRSEISLDDESFREPLTSEMIDVNTSHRSQGQRIRSNTIGLGELYSLETPLKTHRFDRRGAVVVANLPVSPIVTDY